MIDPTDLGEIEGILSDLLQLQCDAKIDNVNLFEITVKNGYICNLVEIPSSSNWKQFRKNLNRRNIIGGERSTLNWVTSTLDAISTIKKPKGTAPITDTQNLAPLPVDKPINRVWRAEAALWMMQHLGSKYTDEFIQAASHIGLPMKPKRQMSAELTAAMWDLSGTSYLSQRVICSYFRNHFGWRLCAPESKVRLLGDTAIPPMLKAINMVRKAVFIGTKN